MTIHFRTFLRGSLAAFGLAAFTAGPGAHAATVTTIFNTGVLTNNPITGAPATFNAPGTVDTHYTVATLGTTAPTAPPATGFDAAFVLNSATFPGTVYPNSGTAQNISVNATGAGTPNTYYDYRTTFDLTGFSTVGASLQGLAFGDNRVAAIFLNGVNTGFVATGDFASSPFTLTSNFVSTINTLDFIVLNFNAGTPEYTAFNGDTLRLNANPLPPPVPEPGSVALLIGIGASGAGFLVRRKRRK